MRERNLDLEENQIKLNQIWTQFELAYIVYGKKVSRQAAQTLSKNPTLQMPTLTSNGALYTGLETADQDGRTIPIHSVWPTSDFLIWKKSMTNTLGTHSIWKPMVRKERKNHSNEL